MPAEINRVYPELVEGDCGVSALASYLDVSYADVWRAAAVVDKHQGRNGLWRRTMQRVAAHLGHKLVQRQTFDPETAYGVVVTHEHAAVLREGFVLDRNGLWEWSAWLVAQKVAADDCVLLVAKE